MTRFRDVLPQLGPDVFLTDSGLETDLLFNQGVDLPQFAAFPLLNDSEGTDRLRTYFGATRPSRHRPTSGSCSKPPPGGPMPTGVRCSASTSRRWTRSTDRRLSCSLTFAMSLPTPVTPTRSVAVSAHAAMLTGPTN